MDSGSSPERHTPLACSYNLRNLRNLRITSSNKPVTKATGPTKVSIRKTELSIFDVNIHCLTR